MSSSAFGDEGERGPAATGEPRRAAVSGSGPGPVAARSEIESGLSERALRAFFGESFEGVRRFHDLLQDQGEVRGLIGPREVPRLWGRHLLNSAALVGYLPDGGSIADVGSGAGLPGVVLALMRPRTHFHLVEPMQRRVAWLSEVATELGLTNVTVHHERVEALHDRLRVDAVTARAVAPLPKLAAWSLPLVRAGGRLVVLKGRQAAREVDAARPMLVRLGVLRVELHEVDPLGMGEPTVVVEIVKR